MTRLRLNVKDKSKVNVEAVKEVKGAIEHNSLGTVPNYNWTTCFRNIPRVL